MTDTEPLLASLLEERKARRGLPPYARIGNYGIVTLAGLFLAAALYTQTRRRT